MIIYYSTFYRNFCLIVPISVLTFSLMTQAIDSSTASVTPTTLKLVQILFRHGDRTPIDPFPTDLHRNYWREGLGQLTNIGKLQHYRLGKYIRTRYRMILPVEYNYESVEVNSTNVDRTIMSASCNLAGLFPPNGSDIWNENLKWQPIPIHTMQSSRDYILDTDSYCPKYVWLFHKLLESAEMRKINDHNKAIYAYLQNKTGKEISSVFDVNQIFDTLFIENLYNLTNPSWVQEVYKEIQDIADMSFTWRYKTADMQRLKGGPLLGHLIDNMLHIVSHVKEKKKLYMFSSHDTSVAALLETLGVFNGIAPPYACAIFIELHRSLNNDFDVQIFYKNSSEEPHKITLPNCSVKCPLDQFIRLAKPLIPKNILEECDADENRANHLLLPDYIVFGCLVILLIISIIIIVALLCWKKHVNNDYRYVMVQNE